MTTDTNTVSPLFELSGAGIGEMDDGYLVDAIDWSVAPREFWVVGGLEATGKSLLLNVAAGLQRPAKGRHRLFGRDTSGHTVDEFVSERLRIGMVFDNGRLMHALTVAENIALPLQYHLSLSLDEVEAEVRRVLELVEMTHLANRKPAHLSPTWQLRAALARALALNPDLLLLDNPTARLDPREIRWWARFVSGLHTGRVASAKSIAIVLATDDLRPWLEDRRQFALLKKNRWLPLGGRAELLRCDEPLLQDLLGAEPRT